VAREWEYRVEMLGGALRSPKPDAVEALLNAAGEVGWEPAHFVSPSSNSNRLMVVLRRRVASSRRAPRRLWP
jgi:hypothetical protein